MAKVRELDPTIQKPTPTTSGGDELTDVESTEVGYTIQQPTPTTSGGDELTTDVAEPVPEGDPIQQPVPTTSGGDEISKVADATQPSDPTATTSDE